MPSIMHRGLNYSGGGSLIEPNPQESATEQLETLGIDGDVYEIKDPNAAPNEPTFTEASTRENLNGSGETIATILGKIKKFFSDLKTVAFTGAYSDLSGTPTIPTVNDGTLTIKQNNNNLGTFTANQSTASNINIECAVPSDVEGSKVATGNPLTITDAAGIKAEKIEIVFTPKQDLHGYDKPWVGGAWKNLLNCTFTNGSDAGFSWTKDTDSDGNVISVTLNGKNTNDSRYFLKISDIYLEAGTYYISGAYNSYASIYVMNVDGGNAYNSNPSVPTSFTVSSAGSHIVYIAVYQGIQFTNARLYPMVSKTNTRDFEPYTNISPITGYTSLSADGCGKQLFDKSNVRWNYLHDGTTEIYSYGKCYSPLMPVEGNTDYYFKNILGGGSFLSALFYDKYGNFIEQKSISGSGTQSGTLKSSANARFVRTNSNTSDLDTTQVEKGTSFTSYEVYKHKNVTIQLGQTLYGGKLTILQDGSADVYCDTGIIDDMGTSADIDWENAAGLIAQGTFPFTITSADYVNQVWLSEAYNIKYQSNWNMNNGEIIVVKTSGGSVGARLQNTSYNTLAGLKASLAGQKLVYALATPFTIHLSPVETLNLLQGINNVWTDGTILSLTYQPDNAIGEVKGDIQEIDKEIQGSKEVFGNPITVTDAANMYAEKVKIDLEAMQDFHGYSGPWLGGAGKNKCRTTLTSQTKDGVTYTVNSDGSIAVSGTPTSYANVDAGEAIVNSSMGNVTFSAFSESTNIIIDVLYVRDSNGTSLYRTENIDNTLTINLANYPTAAKITFSLKRASNGVQCSGVIKPQIEIGTSATPFEPYSNVCPIQGYSEVNVDDCGGKNTLNVNGTNVSNGYISGRYLTNTNATANGFDGFISEYMYIQKGKDKLTLNGLSGVNPSICFYDKNKVFISGEKYNNTFPKTVDIPSNAMYYRASVPNTDKNIAMIEYGSSSSTYESYQGQNVSVQVGNKNKLPMTVDGIKAVNSELTWNGNVATKNNVTFTILTDNEGNVTGIKVNGTANQSLMFNLFAVTTFNGSYTLNGCPSGGGGSSTFNLRLFLSDDSTYISDYGNSASASISNLSLKGGITIYSGYNAQNLVFYPMLRSASVTDSTFSPHNPSLGDMIYGGQFTLNDDGSADVYVDTASVTATEFSARVGVNQFDAAISGMKNTAYSVEDAICDKMPYKVSSYGSASVYGFVTNNGKIICRLPYLAEDSLTAANTWLSSNNLQILYELATPFTLHLSADKLKMLQGLNNVSSNGSTIYLDYQPDNVIAEAKEDVQKLRDDVDAVAKDNYSRNLVFEKLTNYTIEASGRITGSNGFDIHIAKIESGVTYTITSNDGFVAGYFYNKPADGSYSYNGARVVSSNCTFVAPIDGYIAFRSSSPFSEAQCEIGDKQTAYKEYIPTNKELWEMIKALQN